jgi:hypothetical protein
VSLVDSISDILSGFTGALEHLLDTIDGVWFEDWETGRGVTPKFVEVIVLVLSVF